MDARARSLRLLSMLAALFVGFGVVGGRMFWLQVLDSDRLIEMAADQRQRTMIVPAQRGSILASDGTELAISVDVDSVYANPRQVQDARAAAEALAPVLGIDSGTLLEKLTRDAAFVYLARKLDVATSEKVRALDVPGVDLLPESKRIYPAGSLAAQVIGFVGSENEGRGGLEGRYDELLQGQDGRVMVERDPRGRRIPSGESSIQQARRGADVILTVDRQIQFEAERALARAAERWGARGGTIIVMEPATGRVLAMANSPTFDPNNLSASTAYQRRNRAITDIYEPGSVSKMITAAAALEQQVVTEGEVMRVADHLKIGSKVFQDSHGHPDEVLSFEQIIQSSSNVGTILVAQRLGNEGLYDYLARFGFGHRTGIDFPAEAAGILPEPDDWWGTSLGTISIGQGVAVTPLQVTQAYATLANGGLQVKPRLLEATIGPQGRQQVAAADPVRVIDPNTARRVTDILVGVTEDEMGTGAAAGVSGYRVAGKTGTAQKPVAGGYDGYMASFAGFAPADNPQIVVTVVLDDPKPIFAGQTAAITFQEIMEFSLRRLASAVEFRDAPTGSGPLAAPPGG